MAVCADRTASRPGPVCAAGLIVERVPWAAFEAIIESSTDVFGFENGPV